MKTSSQFILEIVYERGSKRDMMMQTFCQLHIEAGSSAGGYYEQYDMHLLHQYSLFFTKHLSTPK